MKTIYIAHEIGNVRMYYEALFEYGSDYGYNIEQVTLSNYYLLRAIARAILKEHSIKSAFRMFLNKIKFLTIKDEIIIVGVPPYSHLLLKYNSIFLRNKAFYHTSWDVWDGTNFPLGALKYKDKFEYILKNSFKAAFCVSKTSAEAMKEFFKTIEIVNHSININSYKHNLSLHHTVKRFIFMGSLSERKNVSLILEWLKYNSNNVEIVFCGRGVFESQIKDNPDTRIKYWGYQSKENIKEFLADFDFMILPSKSELFGVVLIEALACGVPCIVSNTTGPKEIITDGYNGYIFDVNKGLPAFNVVMNKALNITDEEMSRLRSNSYSSSQKYDTDIIAKRWMRIINEND